MTKNEFIDALSAFESGSVGNADIAALIESASKRFSASLFERADAINREKRGRSVKLRGLVEFTNHCKNNCYYCGIRAGNEELARYRMGKHEILSTCEKGYLMGFRTFVLQGGEDGFFTDGLMCDIISSIKERLPDAVITLSIGERSKESYKALYDAGARRYLLRHETASAEHYRCLHPDTMSFQNRVKCLYNLKEIGFETGAGFMVGSPYQNYTALASDLLFLRELQPNMVGIGAFIPHEQTPFRASPAGSLGLTLVMLALTRLLLPEANIPATTALATLSHDGRIKALSAGANVVMPNLTPRIYRNLYTLYNGKISTDEEAAESLEKLRAQLEAAGFELELGKC